MIDFPTFFGTQRTGHFFSKSRERILVGCSQANLSLECLPGLSRSSPNAALAGVAGAVVTFPIGTWTLRSVSERKQVGTSSFRQSAASRNQGGRQAEDGFFRNRTVLLVEDDTNVREISSDMLQEFGFCVLPAETGERAIEICRQHSGTIDLLLSDVVMPGMSGPEMAHVASEFHPEMKVLFMSGYSHDSVVRNGYGEGIISFLQKPFTIRMLYDKVREVLGSKESG